MARNIKALEERIAVLDKKIAKKRTEIAKLESQKYALEHPVSIKDINPAEMAGFSYLALPRLVLIGWPPSVNSISYFLYFSLFNSITCTY